MNRRRFLTSSALALPATALLPGCTPPDGEAGVGMGGTGGFSVGRSTGRVDGFGSVIVAGQRIDDRDARAELVLDPLAPTELPITDIRLGMEVTVAQHDGQRTLIRAEPIVRGIVDQVWIDRGNLLRIGGQWVKVNASPAQPTYLDGFRRWDDLLRLNMMEVYGQRGADGLIYPSYVGTRLKSSPVRVVGVLERFDNSNTGPGTFDIGQMTIWYRSARLAPGLTLRVGGRYAVYGWPLPAPWGGDSGIWMRAETIGPADFDAPADEPVALAGVIESLRDAGTPVINGVAIDVTTAAITGGTRADLRPDAMVRVRGTARGGRLVAEAVEIQRRDAIAVFQMQAEVTDYVGPQSFLLRNAAVDAQAARFENLTAANLGNAVRVKTAGTLRDFTLAASTVAAGEVAAGAESSFVGAITAVDAGTRSFRLLGLAQLFALAAGTRFVDGSAAQVVEGARVTLIATAPAGGTPAWTVRELRFGGDDAAPVLAGVAGTVVAGSSFVLNGIALRVDAGTRYLGPTNSAADLVNGRSVRVVARRVGTDLLATEVDARSSSAARVRGQVSDLITEADLRIGGQRVDASAATFVPAGARATFGAGQYAEAEGTMRDGVLRATTVYRL